MMTEPMNITNVNTLHLSSEIVYVALFILRPYQKDRMILLSQKSPIATQPSKPSGWSMKKIKDFCFKMKKNIKKIEITYRTA